MARRFVIKKVNNIELKASEINVENIIDEFYQTATSETGEIVAEFNNLDDARKALATYPKAEYTKSSYVITVYTCKEVYFISEQEYNEEWEEWEDVGNYDY